MVQLDLFLLVMVKRNNKSPICCPGYHFPIIGILVLVLINVSFIIFPKQDLTFYHSSKWNLEIKYLKYFQNIPYRILVFVIHDLNWLGQRGCFHCKQIKLNKNTVGKNLGGSNIFLSNS